MMRWTDKPERGHVLLIRLIVWLARMVGRPCCRALLVPIAFYFFLTDQLARAASAEFLEAVNGAPSRRRDVFLHLYSFAATLLDRVYIASGAVSWISLTIEGRALIDQALAGGKGCILMGSHLGSFDLLMLAHAGENRPTVNVMMRLDPNSRLRRLAGIEDRVTNLIPLGRPDSYLRAYDALERGDIVAILADRVNGAAHLPTQFLGRTASMPIAPHLLAARSGAPVLMFFGLYEGGNRYRIEFIETACKFSPSCTRADLQPAVDQYAAVLESYARAYPRNWFNFYPYWNDGERRT